MKSKFLLSLFFILLNLQTYAAAQPPTEYQGIIYGTDRIKSDTSVEAIDLQEKKIELIENKAGLLTAPQTEKISPAATEPVLEKNSSEHKSDSAFSGDYSINDKIKSAESIKLKPEIKKKRSYTLLYILGGIAALLIIL